MKIGERKKILKAITFIKQEGDQFEFKVAKRSAAGDEDESASLKKVKHGDKGEEKVLSSSSIANSTDDKKGKSKALPSPLPAPLPSPPSLEKTTKTVFTEEEYDKFLLGVKGGRFKRVGKFTGMSKGIPHICTDPECEREWSPTPRQVLEDDYFCPSCVLHHRNNVERFELPRLSWSADVPNTFYVFSITDPKTKKVLTKFGRTQHYDAWKRYSGTERDNFFMQLLFSVRGRLICTTKIENWWKSEGKKLKLFQTFSDAAFHGKDECLELEQSVLEKFLDFSKKMFAEEGAIPVKAA